MALQNLSITSHTASGNIVNTLNLVALGTTDIVLTLPNGVPGDVAIVNIYQHTAAPYYAVVKVVPVMGETIHGVTDPIILHQLHATLTLVCVTATDWTVANVL
jgi:hypothetical protein